MEAGPGCPPEPMFGQSAVEVGVFAIGNPRPAAGNAAAGNAPALAAGAETAGALAGTELVAAVDEVAPEVLLTTAAVPLVGPVAAEPMVA